MAVTLTSTGVTFPSGNTQTEAVTTNWGGVGSYAVCYIASGTLAGGSTIAGADLRYANAGYALGILTNGGSTFYMQGSYMGVVTIIPMSFSGTWRCMAPSAKLASNTTPQLFVRIS